MNHKLEKITTSFKTFMTNQGENNLKNRINKILKRDNILYFDTLIGFFRMSGFTHIKEYLDKVEKTRILIGINTDEKVYTAYQLKEKFIKEQIEDLNNSENIDENINLMIDLMNKQKLEIGVVPTNDNHSKLYIFRNENPPYDDLQGSVIIGSSNLTYNGLVKHFEMNAELRQPSEIEEATKIFEILWEDRSELTQKDIENKIIPKLKNYTPPKKYSDVFYQSLIHYFDEIINNNLEIKDTKITLFEYQKDAVLSAILKINRYNGAIIGDVVGLGKTIVACAIIKRLHLKTLIIAPPAVHKQWQKTLQDFNISNDDYELLSFDDKNLEKKDNFEFIVIDESHKLKDHKSNRYQTIEKITKLPFRKKVLLLSATLQNNSPQDIANQIYLFQDRNSSNIPNIISLEKFFSEKIAKFKTLKTEKNKEKVKSELKKISNDIKEQILKPLMIRRTREDIEQHPMYKKDMKQFPKVENLKPIKYNLKNLSETFKNTAEYLNKKIKYERFNILNNLNEAGRQLYRDNNPDKIISNNIFDKNDLSTLAKYSFIKRFDSSIYSFKLSLDRAIISLEKFIKNLENDRLYIGDKSIDVLLDESEKYLYDENRDKIYYISTKKEEKIYLKGMIVKKEHIKNVDDYLNRLKTDLDYLNELKTMWKDIKEDPKLDKFLEVIKENKSKLVIFTEFSDTLKYLQTKLPQEIKNKTLFVTSENRETQYEKIAQNFDANYDDKQNDFDIIITTDTLAEGVNLHRSDTLINYDLPWNSTKLMQRLGRINRIGSEFDSLKLYNFMPTDESNDIINLEEKSFLKLQSFHYTLGEDSKLLFDEEEIEEFGIEEDTDEELKYLQIIRDFKNQNPEKFEILKNKQTEAVEINSNQDSELCFFKVNTISYFRQKIENSSKNIDFLQFIKTIENKKQTPTISNCDEMIRYFSLELNSKIFTNNDLNNKLTKKDREALQKIKKAWQNDEIDDETFDRLNELIKAKTSKSFVNDILKSDNLSELDIITTSQTQEIREADVTTKIYVKEVNEL